MPTPRKVALITGGTRGIGLGVARELAAAGFDLALNGRRPLDPIRPVLAELESAGVRAIYCPGDIADLTNHARILDTVTASFGRLDVLVNNAGIAPETRADILDATPESFDRLIAANLRGPYFLTQAAARRMIERRRTEPEARGCIVNISSVSATVASVNRGDYCISKAGVAMATRLWAARLAEFGIDVYEVRPGVVATDMTAAVRERYDALIAGGLTVERRQGEPRDVGRAVRVLACGELSYATGQVLTVDGGLTLQRL